MLGKARLATADLRLSPYKRQRPEIRRVRTFVLDVCIFLVFRCHARAGLVGGEARRSLHCPDCRSLSLLTGKPLPE